MAGVTATIRPATLPPALGAELERRLAVELGFRIAGVEELDPGVAHNNRIYRLRADDGRAAALKMYIQDGRRRLEREYDVLSFLRDRGFSGVPVPLLRSDPHYCAVYTFEPGDTRPAAAWTAAHAVATGRLAAELHAIRPGEPGADFPPAFSATFSYAEQMEGARTRLARFSAYVAGGDVSPEVRALLDACDPVAEVEGLLRVATRDLTAAQFLERTPPDLWRLSPGDFAPHNTLLRDDGSVCLLDFEYAGWDEPAALPACFLTAETCLAMPAGLRDTVLRAYRDAADLPAACLERLDRVSALLHVSWCAVHLQLVTPEIIAKKQFATPALDVPAHVRDQLAKLQHRLEVARRMLRLQEGG
jgi:Ser/Thr protein kinase RdoA (MazF antagonist)